MNITIAGKEHEYRLNMGAFNAIAEHGYSGENGEGDFGMAFAEAEDGNPAAMQLVAWAGLLWPHQDAITGAIDYEAAFPMSVTNLMSFAELLAAAVTASACFIDQLPPGVVEAAAKAAANPPKPRARKKVSGGATSTTDSTSL